MVHKDLSTITQFQTDAMVKCLDNLTAEVAAMRAVMEKYLESSKEGCCGGKKSSDEKDG